MGDELLRRRKVGIYDHLYFKIIAIGGNGVLFYPPKKPLIHSICLKMSETLV